MRHIVSYGVMGHTKKTDSATGDDGRLRLGAGIAGDTTGGRQGGEDVGGEFKALFEFAIALVSMTASCIHL